MRTTVLILYLLSLFFSLSQVIYGENHDRKLPKLPLQFEAELEIIAHLVDRSRDYPPWRQKLKVRYDYIQKLARADMYEGYEAGKIYVRRYDQKREYMIKTGTYQDCQRAYLGEPMPAPYLPSGAKHEGVELVRGIECEHWLFDLDGERIHVYQSINTHVPIRLTSEAIYDGKITPLMTYDFINIVLGAQDPSIFDIPNGYTHKTCTRNIGGFPYIHAFHHYLRF